MCLVDEERQRPQLLQITNAHHTARREQYAEHRLFTFALVHRGARRCRPCAARPKSAEATAGRLDRRWRRWQHCDDDDCILHVRCDTFTSRFGNFPFCHRGPLVSTSCFKKYTEKLLKKTSAVGGPLTSSGTNRTSIRHPGCEWHYCKATGNGNQSSCCLLFLEHPAGCQINT